MAARLSLRLLKRSKGGWHPRYLQHGFSLKEYGMDPQGFDNFQSPIDFGHEGKITNVRGLFSFEESVEIEPAISHKSMSELEPGECLSESVVVNGQEIRWEIGRLAKMADGSCVSSIGRTQVIATAVCDNFPNPETDMVPLQVDFREKLYASGHIPQTYNRREGAPKDREILIMRAIDRALRPLFPKGFCNEVQVLCNVLSADGAQDPDIIAINAASTALMCSDIPWRGPVGAVRIGLVNGELLVNPTTAQLSESVMNLTYAGTENKAVMVECQAFEVSEEDFENALKLAQQHVNELIRPQLELSRRTGRKKRLIKLAGVDRIAHDIIMESIAKHEKVVDGMNRPKSKDEVKRKVLDDLKGRGLLSEEKSSEGGGKISAFDVDLSFKTAEAAKVRNKVLETGKRADGRALEEMRRIHCEVETVPVVHGSALFERGKTQSLCLATVGGDRDIQKVQSVMGESSKHFMLHYSFPPYAVNEVSKVGGVNRREIGHGNLAERGLAGVMPSPEEFPFPVRLTAETMGSNGSSSMAAVCGGALALKNAGIPVKSLAAGISIGLMTDYPVHCVEGEEGGYPCGMSTTSLHHISQYKLLTDIQGSEDHIGDMDFKIAGTMNGITAIQLDIKLPGIPLSILIEALTPAKSARAKIIKLMENALQSRTSPDPPKFGVIEVNKDLVGHIIGEAGETIQRIEMESGARLFLPEDSDQMSIYAPTRSQYLKAETAVLDVQGANMREGEVYSCKVVRIMDFGAFVELPNGFQTLLHISELSHVRLKGVEDVLHEGQELKVQCMGKDDKGNVRISRKALMPMPKPVHE